MTIERVGTNNQSQYMLSRIMADNKALQQSQVQVSSGKVADDYAGFSDKTAALESARAAADRADSYQASTQLALTQTDLQDTQLTTLSGLADQLRQAVAAAVSQGDGTNLVATGQSIFEQASAILNSTDSNGNYIYGGQNTGTKPFTATSLADLSTQPIGNFFVNGQIKKTVQVGDTQTEQIGVLASDIGTGLMTALNQLGQLDASQSLSGQLDTAQVDSLSGTVLPSAKAAAESLNSITAQNGGTYDSLKDAVTSQQAVSSLYKGFVSDIEDVDMATAVVNLNQNQIALQAALSVTARLNQLSLLNYLPASG